MKLLEAISAIVVIILMSSCATAELPKPRIVLPGEAKKIDVLSCVKDLKSEGEDIKDAFEVCRQIYGMQKVREHK